jgi:predicted dehydrogenase
MTRVRIGIIGGGLMGRELAAAIGRWPALMDHPVTPELTAVCDTDPAARAWFERITTVRHTTGDHRELLDQDVDVVYVAVPHDLHESIYVDTVKAGKDLFGEKPFGIDLAAAERIAAAADSSGRFVRCSSEMPFFPGAQAAYAEAASGRLGPLIEARSAFLHSSDLDLAKPINWKRQARACGQAGVLNDLGMHVLHLPMRLGWDPLTVFAVLQDLVPFRSGPSGAAVPCDTIENATLLCRVNGDSGSFPLTVETKRIAPGEKNTWAFSALGMNGGVRFSTRHPKTLWRFSVVDGEQVWQEHEMGSQSAFPTVTGGIFEFGFSDAILQMWASFLAEREGALGGRFGCVTPDEAVRAHRLVDAALRSGATGAAA